MSDNARINPFDNKSGQYILSIRLSTDGFSFCVSDPVQNAVLLFRQKGFDAEMSYTANVKACFREFDFLSARYKEVQVLVVDMRFTMVPLELFDEEHTDTIFYYNLPTRENEVTCKNSLANNSCVILFGMDKGVCNFLNNQYPDVQYYSQAAILGEYFSARNRHIRIKQMFVYLTLTRIHLYCFDCGYISLVNSYECRTVADCSYFILLLWKQLGLDQQQEELLIAGNCPDKKELVDMLRRFVRRVLDLKPDIELGGNAAQVSEIPYDMQILINIK